MGLAFPLSWASSNTTAVLSISLAKSARLHFYRIFAASKANESEMTEQAGEMPKGHGEEILLIDDEIALVEMTRLMLEAHNYAC